MPLPRIYLAIDNCFASKRWTDPAEWMTLLRDLGVLYAEASADNECDPLYTTPEYIDDWVEEVQKASRCTGVKVANLYSGHGTYATLGLTHTDPRVREHILNDWLKPMVRQAVRVGAGLGFACHTFADSVLQDPPVYAEAVDRLYADLARLARYAADRELANLGLEQMYRPAQVPWTIRQARELMQQVYRRSGHPMYLTIDTGHQSGQWKFLKPTVDRIVQRLQNTRAEGHQDDLWLGPLAAERRFEEAPARHDDESAAREIVAMFEDYPYLFCEPRDGDPYEWLKELGCYSPIIHLQQTDGKVSSHWPFTAGCNEVGIIEPRRVLSAIAASYERSASPGLPPRCEKIYLTLEMFFTAATLNRDLLHQYRETVEYWRRFVPEDGIVLSQALKTGG